MWSRSFSFFCLSSLTIADGGLEALSFACSSVVAGGMLFRVSGLHIFFCFRIVYIIIPVLLQIVVNTGQPTLHKGLGSEMLRTGI